MGYYDSLAQPPSDQVEDDLQKLAMKVSPHQYIRYKENGIRDQAITSNSCGYYAMKYLIDTLNRDKSFKQASGYSSIRKAEKEVENFAKRFEGGKMTFPYI
jgi:hypothetical protein